MPGICHSMSLRKWAKPGQSLYYQRLNHFSNQYSGSNEYSMEVRWKPARARQQRKISDVEAFSVNPAEGELGGTHRVTAATSPVIKHPITKRENRDHRKLCVQACGYWDTKSILATSSAHAGWRQMGTAQLPRQEPD